MNPTPLLSALLLLAATPALQLKLQRPGLQREATITYEAATESASARIPGGKIVEAELELEHGRLVYSFDIRTQGKRGIDEVQIDARTGALVSVEHEGPAAEAAEKAADAKEPGAGAK